MKNPILWVIPASLLQSPQKPKEIPLENLVIQFHFSGKGAKTTCLICPNEAANALNKGKAYGRTFFTMATGRPGALPTIQLGDERVDVGGVYFLTPNSFRPRPSSRQSSQGANFDGGEWLMQGEKEGEVMEDYLKGLLGIKKGGIEHLLKLFKGGLPVKLNPNPFPNLLRSASNHPLSFEPNDPMLHAAFYVFLHPLFYLFGGALALQKLKEEEKDGIPVFVMPGPERFFIQALSHAIVTKKLFELAKNIVERVFGITFDRCIQIITTNRFKNLPYDPSAPGPLLPNNSEVLEAGQDFFNRLVDVAGSLSQ